MVFTHTGQRQPLLHLRRTSAMVGLSLAQSHSESTKADDITIRMANPNERPRSEHGPLIGKVTF
jgi:hypothetical protein